MASLRTLHPRLVPWARWIYDLGKSYDPLLVVTSARRSPGKQQQLYDKYRRGESSIPAAPPGGSLHEFGLAFDMARIGVDPLTDPLLNWLGQVWTYYGGRHGGARDPVHFQPRM